jgi:hypothetical protein
MDDEDFRVFELDKTIVTELLNIIIGALVLIVMLENIIKRFALTILAELAEELPVITSCEMERDGFVPLHMFSI